MARINIDSVMNKVKAFSETKEGQERIKKKLAEKRMSKNGELESGSHITTVHDMEFLAEELVKMLKQEASNPANELPQSVIDHFDSLTWTSPKPYGGGNLYYVSVNFTDDLSRMSLMITSGHNKGMRTGGGINNIVSLYDTGYRASKRVFGEWFGHEEDGVIASRTELVGKHFMERAIDSFNIKYGSAYNVVARIVTSSHYYSSFN